jgi:hypothetical protein
VIDCGRDVEPELWRRYLALLLRGLQVDPPPPEALPRGPLAPEDVQRVMSSWEPPRR